MNPSPCDVLGAWTSFDPKVQSHTCLLAERTLVPWMPREGTPEGIYTGLCVPSSFKGLGHLSPQARRAVCWDALSSCDRELPHDSSPPRAAPAARDTAAWRVQLPLELPGGREPRFLPPCLMLCRASCCALQGQPDWRSSRNMCGRHMMPSSRSCRLPGGLDTRHSQGATMTCASLSWGTRVPSPLNPCTS